MKTLILTYKITKRTVVKQLIILTILGASTVYAKGGSHGGGGFMADRSMELLKKAQSEILSEIDQIKSKSFDQDPTRKEMVREAVTNIVPLPKENGEIREGKELWLEYVRETRPYQIKVFRQFFVVYAGTSPEKFNLELPEVKRLLLREASHMWGVDDEAAGRAFALEIYPPTINSKLVTDGNICSGTSTSGDFPKLNCNGAFFGAFTGWEEFSKRPEDDRDNNFMTFAKDRADYICQVHGFTRSSSYTLADIQTDSKGEKIVTALFPDGSGGWTPAEMQYDPRYALAIRNGKLIADLVCVKEIVNPNAPVLVKPPATSGTEYWSVLTAEENSKLKGVVSNDIINKKAQEICEMHGYSQYLGGGYVKIFPMLTYEGSKPSDYSFQKDYKYVDIGPAGVGSTHNLEKFKVQYSNPWKSLILERGKLYFPVLIKNVICKK